MVVDGLVPVDGSSDEQVVGVYNVARNGGEGKVEVKVVAGVPVWPAVATRRVEVVMGVHVAPRPIARSQRLEV